MIKFVLTETGLSFPEFEEGSQLRELVNNIANALGTEARQPTGSPLEVLVGFENYPDQFALWWDSFSCELGCADPNKFDVEAIANRLSTSGLFFQA